MSDADSQRLEALRLHQALVQTHVDLGRRAKQLLALIDLGGPGLNQDELFADLERVTTRMEAIDAQIREGERLLGIATGPAQSRRPN